MINAKAIPINNSNGTDNLTPKEYLLKREEYYKNLKIEHHVTQQEALAESIKELELLNKISLAKIILKLKEMKETLEKEPW